MELPNITIPKIDLPFNIDPLLHPAVVHFAIALPVIILLLEFYNVFVKRKSIGVFSFILIVLAIVMLVASYFTGVVDAKEAYGLDLDKEQELIAEEWDDLWRNNGE